MKNLVATIIFIFGAAAMISAITAFPAMAAGKIKPIHSEILYTQVRVKTHDAGGSGTVIYSEKHNNAYSVYVITCHHVIEGAIKLETKWDPLLARDRKQEMRNPVVVEWFDYAAVPHGLPPLTNGTSGDIMAYDHIQDMALVRVQLTERAPYIAKLYPRESVPDIAVADPVIVVGCALLHDPILTRGDVSHMGDLAGTNQRYWMSTAAIIYGNSGGSVFTQRDGTWHFIGIPSRVDVVGWTPVTHLGYFSPITRIYKFFEDSMFDFLIPGSKKTEEQCEQERKAKRELEEKKLRSQ